MYEIFGVAYGWDCSEADEEVKGLIQEDVFDHLGGRNPYCGAGEGTTYIGVDIGSIDCVLVSDGLAFDTFNNTIQTKLKKQLATNKFAKDIKKWRTDVLAELKQYIKSGDINQKQHDNFKSIIDKEPTLFWTWATS